MSGSFLVYLIGYFIMIAGVAYAMNAAGLGSQWIIAIVLVMVGLGIVYALSRSQQDKAINTQAKQTNPPADDTGRGAPPA